MSSVTFSEALVERIAQPVARKSIRVFMQGIFSVSG